MGIILRRLGLVLIFALLFINVQFVASAQDNLAYEKGVRWEGMNPNGGVVTDGIFLPEGEEWNHGGAITSTAATGFIIVDLGEPKTIQYLAVQADWNESYIIDAGITEADLARITVIPAKGYVQGLRTRVVELPLPVSMRFIRVRRGGGGDNLLSISELQAWKEKPPYWDKLEEQSSLDSPTFMWIPGLTAGRVDILRFFFAVCGTLLCALLIVADRFNLQEFYAKVCTFLAILAFFSFFAWNNFMQFHYESMVHKHEFFHYYLGSKYHHELSYTNLYECSTVADWEDQTPPENKTLRDLRTNLVHTVDPASFDREQCKGRFTSERWLAFKRDLSWFRTNMKKDGYQKVFTDHGFNGTPIWTIFGNLISNLAPASTSQIYLIGVLDYVLLILMWYFVWQTFGVIPACLGIIFWGSNAIATFAWTGNAFLRADWVVASVLGLCALKKQKHFCAGALITYAGLTRIFPFALFIPLVLKFLAQIFSRRKFSLTKDYQRLLLGSLSCVVITGAVYLSFIGSWQQVSDFLDNTKKHFVTTSTNIMGLKVIMSFRTSTLSDYMQDPLLPDSFVPWKDAVTKNFSALKYVYFFISALFVGLIAFISKNKPDWYAASLGLLIPFLISLSNYDYYFLLWSIPLIAAHLEIGLALMIVTLVPFYCSNFTGNIDFKYFLISLVIFAYAIFLVVFCFKKREQSVQALDGST